MIKQFQMFTDTAPKKELASLFTNNDFMNKVFFSQFTETEKSPEIKHERDVEKEENFMNLWGYLRRRYPQETLEEKHFSDLIHLKIHLEGPRRLREWTEDIASVRKH